MCAMGIAHSAASSCISPDTCKAHGQISVCICILKVVVSWQDESSRHWQQTLVRQGKTCMSGVSDSCSFKGGCHVAVGTALYCKLPESQHRDFRYIRSAPPCR